MALNTLFSMICHKNNENSFNRDNKYWGMECELRERIEASEILHGLFLGTGIITDAEAVNTIIPSEIPPKES